MELGCLHLEGMEPALMAVRVIWGWGLATLVSRGLHTPEREHMIDQTDTVKVQLSELMSFIGVTCRNIGEVLLT